MLTLKVSSLFTALLFLSSQSFAAGTCHITAAETSGAVDRQLGKFDIVNYKNGVEFGELQVSAYDAGYSKYAQKTTSFQLTIDKYGKQEPYIVTLWYMTKGRKAETKTAFKVHSLPIEAEIKLDVNNKGNAVVSESTGLIQISCK